jgi:membrane protein insertase Oxa1/YidC/SpoIIIJ
LYSFLSNFSVLAIQTKFYFIDLISVGWWVGWILAIAVRAVQFTQIKLSMIFNKPVENKTWVVLEKKQWDTDYASFMPDQAVMNKFMLYGMPVMVWIFTFTFYIWVGIYWWISTTFMIIQQIVVNKIIKKSI